MFSLAVVTVMVIYLIQMIIFSLIFLTVMIFKKLLCKTDGGGHRVGVVGVNHETNLDWIGLDWNRIG